MESTRPDSYSIINEKEKAALIKHYESGMTTTTASDKVVAAADETGLSMERIKVLYIKNQISDNSFSKMFDEIGILFQFSTPNICGKSFLSKTLWSKALEG